MIESGLAGPGSRLGSVIIEDDPYGDLRFEGDPLPSLAELALGRVPVIGVYTFSKILAPGLRVGWVTAPALVIAKMIDARQCMDTCTNVPVQRVIRRFLDSGALGQHLHDVQVLYRERCTAMMTALNEVFGGTGASWSQPEGGFFVWLTLPEGCDFGALLPTALRRGIAYVPGSAFTAVPGRFTNSVRLCYATTPPDRIHAGIRLLRDVVAEVYPDVVDSLEPSVSTISTNED